MPGIRILTVLLLLLGGYRPSFAMQIMLAWDWPQRDTWTLHIVHTTAAMTTQHTQALTPIADQACRTRDPAYQSGHTWCAEIPCPQEGLYSLYLKDTKGEVSNTVMFGLDSACTMSKYEDMLADISKPDGDVTPADIPDETDAAPIPTEDQASPLPPPVPTPAPGAPLPAPAPPAIVPPQPAPTPLPPVSPEPPPARPVMTHPTPSPAQPAPSQPSPAPAPAGTNLVAAPTAAQPWRSGSFAGTQAAVNLDPTVQRNGHPVQQLTGQGGYYATTTSRAFAVEAGQTYDVSAWVKLEHMTEFVEVDVFYWNTHGQQLARWGEAVGGRLTGTHDWTPLHGEVTIPPGADRAVLQVRAKSHGGRAWVDDVQMVAKDHTPVVVAAPPREPEVTPASPLVPPTPSPLAAVPTAAPAQRRQALQEQFDRLKQDYEAAQRTIRETYEATLKALEKDTTPSGQQQRQQAYETGTQALDTVYKTLLEAWTGLAAQWERVP